MSTCLQKRIFDLRREGILMQRGTFRQPNISKYIYTLLTLKFILSCIGGGGGMVVIWEVVIVV